MNEDTIYEELEYTSLLEIEEIKNFENIDHYYEDYEETEKDLTQIIKDRR